MNRVSTGIWIAPQIEVLAIAPHPTSFSAIAAQIGVVVMGDRANAMFDCRTTFEMPMLKFLHISYRL